MAALMTVDDRTRVEVELPFDNPAGGFLAVEIGHLAIVLTRERLLQLILDAPRLIHQATDTYPVDATPAEEAAYFRSLQEVMDGGELPYFYVWDHEDAGNDTFIRNS